MGFTNLVLTSNGKTIYAKSEMGHGIYFSRIGIGDGVFTGSMSSRTALVSERMSLAIDGKQLVSDGTETALITTMDNKDVQTAFFYREIGIFAIDPNTKLEVLCLYDNAGAEAEEIPPGSIRSVYERLVFLLKLDSTQEISYNWSGIPLYVPLKEFEAALSQKVDKVTGKALSSNDYTAAEKTKLSGIATGANLYVHPGSGTNPHGTTKTDVGLSAVPNVATNDQTPTYTVATVLAALASGEKLTLVLGKLAKAVADLISHLANKSNPHGVSVSQIGAAPASHNHTPAQAGAAPVSHTHSPAEAGAAPVSHTHTPAQAGAAPASHTHTTTQVTGLDAALDTKVDKVTGKALSSNDYTAADKTKLSGITTGANLYVHPGSGTNPHGTTKTDVGLSAVPNVATNDQTPTYTVATALATLASGEKLTVVLGKLAKAVADLISHIANRSNPHGVSVSQIGAAAASHNHTPAQAGAAPASHAHTTTQVTGLDGALAGKSPTSHTHSGLAPVAIPASADLNNYTTVGLRCCQANATVATLKNCPTANAFSLEVGMHAGVYQRLVEYITDYPRVFFRNNYSGVWMAWQREYTTANKPTLAELGAAPASHGHTTAQVTGLDGALAGKAPSSHSHSTANVTGLDAALSGKAPTSHTHTPAQAGAAPASHTHPKSQITDFPTSLPANGGTSAACSGNAATATRLATARTIAGNNFDGTVNISITAAQVGAAPASHTHTPAQAGAAPASHTHTTAQVTGLDTALAGKASAARLTELVVPLTAGLIDWGCTYCKSPDGVVTIKLSLCPDSGKTLVNSAVVSTLPTGYRPTEGDVRLPVYCDGGTKVGLFRIYRHLANVAGQIQWFGPTLAYKEGAYACGAYLAVN